MAPQDDRHNPHWPGAISMFFVVKAAIFAAGFWIWLAALAIGGSAVSGWMLFAASGAITTTLVGVVLGIRLALQADAAKRHARVEKLLVEIHWNTAFAAGHAPDNPDNVLPFPSAVHDSGGWGTRQGGSDSNRTARRGADSGGWQTRGDNGERGPRR
jgi:hypothetical protein